MKKILMVVLLSMATFFTPGVIAETLSLYSDFGNTLIDSGSTVGKLTPVSGKSSGALEWWIKSASSTSIFVIGGGTPDSSLITSIAIKNTTNASDMFSVFDGSDDQLELSAFLKSSDLYKITVGYKTGDSKHPGVSLDVSSVPIPAAIWLFGSALLGLVGISRRKSRSAMTV